MKSSRYLLENVPAKRKILYLVGLRAIQTLAPITRFVRQDRLRATLHRRRHRRLPCRLFLNTPGNSFIVSSPKTWPQGAGLSSAQKELETVASIPNSFLPKIVRRRWKGAQNWDPYRFFPERAAVYLHAISC